MITQDALKKAFDLKAKAIEKHKNDCAATRARAFTIEEISKAQAEYTVAKFNALKNGDSLGTVDEKKKAYENALAKYGFKESDFTPAPLCKYCRDTGYIHGVLCECVTKLYLDELARVCEIEKRAPFSFEDNRPDKADEKQKDALNKLYDLMSLYVDRYPHVNKHVLVFTGATGTGKSCLASAMARKTVLYKGRSALVLSAYEYNAKMLEAHLAPLEKRTALLEDILTADLLVIDDLGTEPIYKNVTIEYLQLTLDERLREKRTTVVTTNLDESTLMSRYGERIFSRLTDFEHSLYKRIPGKDLRLS